jgi:dienelactone hydrolase
LDYLRSRTDVRPNGIGILGQSYGVLAMLFTIADDALPKNVSSDKDFRLAVALYPNCPALLAAKPHWKPRQQMLFLMGDSDKLHPSRSVQRNAGSRERRGWPLHRCAPLSRYVSRIRSSQSSNDGFDPEARADAIKRVTAFCVEATNGCRALLTGAEAYCQHTILGQSWSVPSR